MNTDKNKRIEDIMASLDGSARATVPDYFYTRLKAKMEKGISPEPSRPWILRPAYAFSVLLLLLAVNAFVLLRKDQPAANDFTISDTDAMQSIASEYSINSSITYDINQ